MAFGANIDYSAYKQICFNRIFGDQYSKFFENSTFLSHGINASSMIQSNPMGARYLHLPYLGERRGAVKITDKSQYPLPKKSVNNKGAVVELCYYSTCVREHCWFEDYGLQYDMKNLYGQQDRDALQDIIVEEGIWNVGPDKDLTNTPICCTPDTNPVGEDGYYQITRKDILALRKKLDQRYPGKKNAKWCLILPVCAYWGLIENDEILKGQQMNLGLIGAIYRNMDDMRGPLLEIAGFELLCDDRTPWYDDQLCKLPYGSTPTEGTDLKSAIAYMKDESFVVALDQMKFFETLGDACEQNDQFSAAMPGYIGLPVDGKLPPECVYHIGAITQKPGTPPKKSN